MLRPNSLLIIPDTPFRPIHRLTRSNNPDKAAQLVSYGIEVSSRTPLVVGVSDSNRFYLETKVERMGHTIDEGELEP